MKLTTLKASGKIGFSGTGHKWDPLMKTITKDGRRLRDDEKVPEDGWFFSSDKEWLKPW